MTQFTINPRVVYSGDTCYVTLSAFIVISQSIYLLTHLGARTSTMSCLDYSSRFLKFSRDIALTNFLRIAKFLLILIEI